MGGEIEASSYGFRPKRSTLDAIENLFTKLHSKSTKTWIFEGDFKGCFDNLNHEHITTCIQGFPGQEIVRKWLEAGYIDNDTFYTTEKGTPQGVLSLRCWRILPCTEWRKNLELNIIIEIILNPTH